MYESHILANNLLVCLSMICAWVHQIPTSIIVYLQEQRSYIQSMVLVMLWPWEETFVHLDWGKMVECSCNSLRSIRKVVEMKTTFKMKHSLLQNGGLVQKLHECRWWTHPEFYGLFRPTGCGEVRCGSPTLPYPTQRLPTVCYNCLIPRKGQELRFRGNLTLAAISFI